ncbi:signal peptide peptidase A. Serine peptidase. MEROPS family S49 [Geodermatophilus obscurus]|uniref:Signal peptide peptidase A. Serine peptidase. MEROPS family S49 n=1 Tax=Geodermatophilus obscurus TaxID=1861 RepID=A0A1M7UYH1_9ACTN|nr:S49 family peptidase [Geodermatophilus obscurus]SHN88018.1 signal peptide peptidase A. Serine peptidase. MEROPS family S49 [Geodermatophilus obscurus]
MRQPSHFRRGFALGLGATLGAGVVLAVVAVGLTMVMVLALVGLTAGGDSPPSGPPTETVWGAANAPARLIAVPVTGVILGSESDGVTFGGATYGYDVADTIDALETEDADGLILELNTPGGTIHGSRAIADAVERYQKRTGNQVMAHVQGMSASGGVYAMAGADQVVADHGSLVGSIGVIMGPFQRFRDVTGIPGSLLEPGVTTDGGVTEEYLTRGRGKDFGNPYRDMTEEERAVLGRGLDREYEAFVGWVSQTRGIPPQTIVDELGAFVFDSYTAVDRGLVDRVLGRQEAYRHAAEMNGVDPEGTRVDRTVAPGLVESLLAAEWPASAAGAGAVAGEPGRSVVCTGAPLVLAYHGELSAACTPR